MGSRAALAGLAWEHETGSSGARGCLAYGVLPQALAFKEKEEQGNHIKSLPLNTPPTSDNFNLRGFPESVALCLFSNLQWISFSKCFSSLSVDPCAMCIHNILGKVFPNYTMCYEKRY